MHITHNLHRMGMIGIKFIFLSYFVYFLFRQNAKFFYLGMQRIIANLKPKDSKNENVFLCHPPPTLNFNVNKARGPRVPPLPPMWFRLKSGCFEFCFVFKNKKQVAVFPKSPP